MIGVLLMIKRFIKLYVSDLGLQFTNRSLTIKFQTLYVDYRRQSMFDKLLQSTRVNDKCSTEFTYAGYVRFVLLTYFGWTSLEGYYKVSLLARFICLLLTRYQLNKIVYTVIHRGTTPAWWFWFLLVNRQEIEIQYFKQRVFLNYYTSNLMLTWSYGLFGDQYNHYLIQPINNRRQPIWFYMRYRWEHQWLPFWLWFNDQLVYRRVIYYRVRDYLVLPTGSKRTHYGVAQMFFANRYRTVTNYWLENQATLFLSKSQQNLNQLFSVDGHYLRVVKTKHYLKKKLTYLKRRYRQTNRLTFFARVERRWWRDELRFLSQVDTRLWKVVSRRSALGRYRARTKFKNHQRATYLIKNYPWRQPLHLDHHSLIGYNPYQYDQTITDYSLFGDDYLIPFEDQQDDASPSGDEIDHQNYDYGLLHGYDMEIPYGSRRRPRIEYTSTNRRLTVEGLAMKLFKPYRRKFEVQPVEDDYTFVFNQGRSPLLDEQRLLTSGDGPSAVDHEYDEEEIEQQQTDLAYLHDWSLTQVMSPTLNETNYHDGTFGWFFNWSQFNHQRLNLMSSRQLLHTSKQFKNTWQINAHRRDLRRFSGGRRLRKYHQRLTLYMRQRRSYQYLSRRRQLHYFPPRYPLAEAFVPFKFQTAINFKFFHYYRSGFKPRRYVQKRAHVKYLPRRLQKRFKFRARNHRRKSRLEQRLNFNRVQRQPSLYFYQVLSRLAHYRFYYNRRYLINRPQPRRLAPNQYYNGFFSQARLLHPEALTPSVNGWWVLAGLLVVDDWYDYRWDTDHQQRAWVDWPWSNFFTWSAPAQEGYDLLNQASVLTQYDRLPPRVGYQRWHIPTQLNFQDDVENYLINQFRFLHLQGFTFNRETAPLWTPLRTPSVGGRALVEGFYFNNVYYEPQYYAPFYPQYEDPMMPYDNERTVVDFDYMSSQPLLTYKTIFKLYAKMGNLYFKLVAEAYLEWLQTRYNLFTYYSTRYAAPSTVGARTEFYHQRMFRNQLETPPASSHVLRLFHLGNDHLLEKPVNTRRYQRFEYLQVTSPWENHLNSLLVKEWRQQSQQLEINFRTSLERTSFLSFIIEYYHQVKAYLLENNHGLRWLAFLVGPYYFIWYYRVRHLNTEYQRVLPQTSYVKVQHRTVSGDVQIPDRHRLSSVDQHGYLLSNTFARGKHLASFYPPDDEVMEDRWLPTEKQKPTAVGMPEHYPLVRSRYITRPRAVITGVRQRVSINRHQPVYIQKLYKLSATGYKKNQWWTRFNRYQPYSLARVRTPAVVYHVDYHRSVADRPTADRIWSSALLLRLATTKYYRRRPPTTLHLQFRPPVKNYPTWVVRPLTVKARSHLMDQTLTTSEIKRTKVNQRHSFLKQFQPFLADEHEIMGERNYFHHYDTEFRYRMVRHFKKKSVYGSDLTSNYSIPIEVGRGPTTDRQQTVFEPASVNLVVQQNLQHQITTTLYHQSLSGCELPLLPTKPGLYYNTVDQLRSVKFPSITATHYTTGHQWVMVDSDCDYQDQQFYGDNGDEDQSGDFVLQHDSLFAEYQTVEYLLSETHRLITVDQLLPISTEQRVRQNLTSYRRFYSLSTEHYRRSTPTVDLSVNGRTLTELMYGSYSVDHPAYQQMMLASYHLPVAYRRVLTGRSVSDLGYQQLNQYKYYFKFQKTTPQYLGDLTSLSGGERIKFKLNSLANGDYPVCNTQRSAAYTTLSEYPLLTYEYLNTLEVHTVDQPSVDVAYLENDQTVSTFNELSVAYNFNTLVSSQIYLFSLWRPTELAAVYQPVVYPAGINPDREIITDLVNHTRLEHLLLEQLLNTYHEGYDTINYYTELQNDWTYHNEYVDDPDHDEEEDLSELTSYDLPVGFTRYALATSLHSSEDSTYERLANQQVSTTFDYLIHLNLKSKRHLLDMADVYHYYTRRQPLAKYQRQRLRRQRLIGYRLNPSTYLPVVDATSITCVNHQQSLTMSDLNQQQVSEDLLMDNFFTFWSLTETYYNDTPNGYTTGY